jgi:hypothetical protein
MCIFSSHLFSLFGTPQIRRLGGFESPSEMKFGCSLEPLSCCTPPTNKKICQTSHQNQVSLDSLQLAQTTPILIGTITDSSIKHGHSSHRPWLLDWRTLPRYGYIRASLNNTFFRGSILRALRAMPTPRRYIWCTEGVKLGSAPNFFRYKAEANPEIFTVGVASLINLSMRKQGDGPNAYV